MSRGWLRRRAWWLVMPVLLVAVLGGGMFAYRQHEQGQITAAACSAVRQLEVELGGRRSEALAGTGPLIAVVGDSYAQGQHLPDPMHSYAYRVAGDLGDRLYVNGSGGTGFVNEGPCGDEAIPRRVVAVSAVHPAVVVLQGGINDLGFSGVEQAVTTSVRRAMSAAPGARIVVVGCFAPPKVQSQLAAVRALNEEIRRGAVAGHAQFVDPSSWQFSTLPDGNHPDTGGAQQVGDLLAAALR